eukprot:9288750-Lingulodinium_polyedra.AAC.1
MCIRDSCIFQLVATQRWHLSMGDVKTAFLQGDMGESERQIYGDPPPDARRLWGLSHDDLLKLEGS